MLSLDEIEPVFEQHYFDGMGAVTRGDVNFLCDLLQHYQPKKCFEVGVASGMSTVFMLLALAKLGPDRQLISVDISRQYYADRTKQVGYLVDAVIPQLGCKFDLHFNHWSADAEKFAAAGKFDFVFIDAHHSHPWATLDTLLVLPFLKPDTWIAVHDIALKDIPKFATETGPFNIYQSFPTPKKKSSLENQNIGAFQIAENYRDYEDCMLTSLTQPWTVSGLIKQSFYERIYDLTERFYSKSFVKAIRSQIEDHNRRIADQRSNDRA